jgi:plasmid replication initiation protein
MLDERIVKRSVKAMQETSISFITTEELNGKKKIKEELSISLLPLYKIVYGKSKIQLKLFVKIAKLFIDVERNYTYLNTKQFMKLDSKHSIRMLGLLNKIDDYDCKIKKENIEAEIQKNLDPIQSGLITDEKQKQAIYKKNRELKTKDIAKVKEMDLQDLNEFFGTSYTKWYDLERKVLKTAQEELKNKSPLYFWYDVDYESVGVGRPKFSTVRIYPKLQSGVQTRLASFI